MSNKRYPELFERIHKYVTLVAYETFMLPADKAEDFIRRESLNRYRYCSKQVTKGECTLAEVMDSFPLD